MNKQHHYKLSIRWTGNTGKGTADYRAYQRSHVLQIENKADILCSSDPAFRGDHTKHNPEEFLLGALSSCHMLWYLHLCADAGIVVTDYVDHAEGIMQETESSGGHFMEVILRPTITITDSTLKEKADALHAQAHKFCFIANSVNFPVHHKANYKILDA